MSTVTTKKLKICTILPIQLKRFDFDGHVSQSNITKFNDYNKKNEYAINSLNFSYANKNVLIEILNSIKELGNELNVNLLDRLPKTSDIYILDNDEFEIIKNSYKVSEYGIAFTDNLSNRIFASDSLSQDGIKNLYKALVHEIVHLCSYRVVKFKDNNFEIDRIGYWKSFGNYLLGLNEGLTEITAQYIIYKYWPNNQILKKYFNGEIVVSYYYYCLFLSGLLIELSERTKLSANFLYRKLIIGMIMGNEREKIINVLHDQFGKERLNGYLHQDPNSFEYEDLVEAVKILKLRDLADHIKRAQKSKNGINYLTSFLSRV